MRWQRALLEGVHPRGGSRLLPPLELKDHDPGAFVRALWAWNFALDETLYGGHRDLAAAVRSGNATHPPSDLRLWIAATMSLDMWTLRVRDGYAVTTDLTQGGSQQRESGLWSQEPELIDLRAR
jgi:hypothetical protein